MFAVSLTVALGADVGNRSFDSCCTGKQAAVCRGSSEPKRSFITRCLHYFVYPLCVVKMYIPVRGTKTAARTNLLGDLVDPVGGAVAEIGALWVPGPSGEDT